MKVVGAVGRIGSGKDELVGHLQTVAKALVYSLGDMVRETAAAENLEPTRENLQSVARRYASRKGEDYFIRKLADQIDRENPALAAITGIRKPVDAKVLRERYGAAFLLVYVSANFNLRFQRNLRRGELRDPKSAVEFRLQNRKEEELFHLSQTIRMADMTLDNSGTLEELHRQIEARILPWLEHC
jgi:dephospho-CoA kinase